MACEIDKAIKLLREVGGPNIQKSLDNILLVETKVKQKITKELSTSLPIINHSGGAIGADSIWQTIGEKYGVITNAYYYKDKTPLGNKEITEKEFNEGIKKANAAAKATYGFRYSFKDNKIGRLLARNWQQVVNSDVVLAVTPITKKGGKPFKDSRIALKDMGSGGTSYAIEMAIQNDTPVYIFDDGQTNKWYKWENNSWVLSTPAITNNFAGIGSRNITAAGKKAIEDVYDSVFKKDDTLGSELYTQMGSNGKGNDVAYRKLQERTEKTLEYWKTQIGEIDRSNNQRVKDVKLVNDVVIVSYTKGPDVRKQSTDTLGSDNKAEPEVIEANEQKDVLISKEKIKDFARMLFKEANGKVSQEYLDTTLALLDNIHPDFLPEMQLYLNREAEKNRGMVKSKKIVIESSSKELGVNNSKSSVEVYAHEMMHAITKFAINNSTAPEAQAIVRQIQSLRDRASKVITPDMLENKNSLDPVAEKKLAENMWNYIFTGENSIHEFIAHGLTNPVVIEVLKNTKIARGKDATSLWELIKNAVSRLIEVVTGDMTTKQIGQNYHQSLMELTFELAKYNNKATRRIENNKEFGEKVSKLLDKVGNEPLAKMIDTLIEKMSIENVKKPVKNDRASHMLWLVKYLPQLMVNDKIKGTRETVLTALGMSPDGVFQNIIRDFDDPTDLERFIEQLGLDATQLNRFRELTAATTRQSVQEGFKKKLDDFQEEALTNVIVDTDMSSIYEDFNTEEIIGILNGTVDIQQIIDGKVEELPKEYKDWFIAQTRGLGLYLATGKANIAQYMNAYSIAKEVGLESNSKVIHLVDMIATLEGLKRSPKVTKEEVAKLMKEDIDGVNHVIAVQKVVKNESNRLFDTPVNKIKGYSKEIFDDSITVRVAPLSRIDKMKAEGFILEQKLDKDINDNSKDQMGLFISSDFLTRSYNSHATLITDKQKRGTGFKDIAYAVDNMKEAQLIAERDISKLRKKRLELMQDMKDGKYELDLNPSLSAVLNDAGEVVDFRYSMSKWQKKTLLKQETRVGEVLGRTKASIDDKISTDIQNQAVLDVILADMKENYLPGFKQGKNNRFYIKIENNSPNKKVQEIYAILPHSMKEAIRKSDRGYIAVRQDMLHNYFGFRDPSIFSIEFIDKFTPVFLKKVIRLAEMMWQSIVSISKVDIVIRTPIVFIGNVISNLMLSILNGTSPSKVFKRSMENFKAINKYLENEHKIAQLKLDKSLGKDVDKYIARLEADQRQNKDVHDLMKAGMYQAIMEDLNRQDFKSSNKLARMVDEKTGGLPSYIRDGAHLLYISEKTGLFKMMTHATQMSDFVARVTEYQFNIERGISKDKAKWYVLDAFVNYTKPASSFEEYLNNMGLVMFTKYAKRIQRAIRTSAKKKPLNVLLSIIAQEIFFDIDDIYDQNLLTRSYRNIDQDMFDHVLRAITPTTLEVAL